MRINKKTYDELIAQVIKMISKRNEQSQVERDHLEEVTNRANLIRPICNENLIPNPKGIFVKKCPYCKSKLINKNVLFSSRIYEWGIYYVCPSESCEYEYVEIDANEYLCD